MNNLVVLIISNVQFLFVIIKYANSKMKKFSLIQNVKSVLFY